MRDCKGGKRELGQGMLTDLLRVDDVKLGRVLEHHIAWIVAMRLLGLLRRLGGGIDALSLTAEAPDTSLMGWAQCWRTCRRTPESTASGVKAGTEDT